MLLTTKLLRLRTGTFEAAATASQLQPAAEAKLSAALPGGHALRLAVAACLWGCLQRTLSPRVFLRHLGDKFTRVLTQLLVRYDSWLSEVVTQRQQAAEAAAAAAAAAGQQQAPPQSPGGDMPSTAAPAEGLSGPAAWAPSMAAESAAAICADADTIKVSGALQAGVCAHALSRQRSVTPDPRCRACCCSQALVQGPLVEQVQGLLAGLPEDVLQQLVDMLSQLADSIGQHGQQVRVWLCVYCPLMGTASSQLSGMLCSRVSANPPPRRVVALCPPGAAAAGW
jgi:hypothetical protein